MKTSPQGKPARETNPAILRQALMRKVGRRIVAEGQIEFPCVPSLLDTYIAKLSALWDVLGKPFSEADSVTLRAAMQSLLHHGWATAPYSLLVVAYQTQAPPLPGIRYEVRLKPRTRDDIYAEWVAEKAPPLFGQFPDAKVLALAAQLGPAPAAPVLDIGAGTGRNALPLAKLGHPTDAIEPAPALVDQMREAAAVGALALEIVPADVLSPELTLKEGYYKLIILAEVVPHFRTVEELRTLFAKVAPALAPGGLVLASMFLASDGYRPDTTAREISQVAWSFLLTRAEIACLHDELPFDRISDESVHDYEKAHLPSEGWPPTGWFVDWSQGRDLFSLPGARPPLELRWLVYRRR